MLYGAQGHGRDALGGEISICPNSCPRVGSHDRSLAGIRLDLIPAYELSFRSADQ